MDILESLENLNVSEECFDEIIGIIEEVIKNPELVKQYGTTEVQKLPKEVRRMYYPRNKEEITGSGKLRERWGARRHARSHQQLNNVTQTPINYIPKSSQNKIKGSIRRHEGKLEKKPKSLDELMKLLRNN